MDITVKITEVLDITLDSVIMELYDAGLSFPEIAFKTDTDEAEVERIICGEIAKGIAELA